MLRFYDNLFYFIYRFYAAKEKGAATSSAMIIGGLQASNVLSIFMLPAVCKAASKSYLNPLAFVIIGLFFMVLNYIRYIYKEKVTLAQLEKDLETKTEAERTNGLVWRSVYIIVSVGALFGLAIYLGSQDE